MTRKKIKSSAADEERHLENQGKMSREAKETLEKMAGESKPRVCVPHEHGGKCIECFKQYKQGFDVAVRTPGPERVVYRIPWYVPVPAIYTLCIAGLMTFYCFHPITITKTIEIPDHVQEALVSQMNAENGELRDELHRAKGDMAAVHDLLDEGKFHLAYKLSKQR